MVCTGVFLTAAPAQAAYTLFNIMLIGSTIPAGVGSVDVDPVGGGPSSGRGCVANVQPGRDRDTGMKMVASDGKKPTLDIYIGTAGFYLYGDSHCSDSSKGSVVRDLPSGITTKNWWVSLS